MNYVRKENEIAEKVVVNASSGLRAARGNGSVRVAAEARVQLEVGVSEKLMIKIRRAQGLLGQKLRRGATLEETLEAIVEGYLSKHDPNERAKRQLLRGKLETPSENSDLTQAVKSTKDGNATKDSQSARQTSNLQFPRIAGEMGASTTANRANAKGLKRATYANTPWTKRFGRRRPLPAATKHRVFLKFQARCSHVDQQGERCCETKFLEIHHIKPLYAGGDDRLENLTLLCSGHHKGIHLG
jgi:hypothetical protein